MLTNGNFWVGFALGVVAVWGYHKYTASKTTGA